MTNEELYNQVMLLSAKEELRELTVRFVEFLDECDYSEAAVRKIFTEDGSIEFPTGCKGIGIGGIINAHKETMKAFVSVNHNISNQLTEITDETHAMIYFHMHVTHEFTPEIAASTPGNLFIVNDRVIAEAKKMDGEWRFVNVKLNGLYKVIESSIE